MMKNKIYDVFTTLLGSCGIILSVDDINSILNLLLLIISIINILVMLVFKIYNIIKDKDKSNDEKIKQIYDDTTTSLKSISENIKNTKEDNNHD